MILPTKRITQERCLLAIGAEVISLLDEPKTVSRVWDDFKRLRLNDAAVTYDWFVLALDLLYMISVIRINKGVIEKATYDSANI
jgi:hypothetical protein